MPPIPHQNLHIQVIKQYNKFFKKKREGENPKQRKTIAKCQVSTSNGGTRFATFRTVKASPGSNPRMTEGQTLESAQAITMNCCLKELVQEICTSYS